MSAPSVPRILILGGGSIGERHARCFLRTGRCRVSLCDIDAALCARLAAAYPLDATFTAYEAALEQPWNAMVIATPAHLHVAQALQAATRGIHLLLEKPLSTTLRDVQNLHRIVAERGLTTAVAYVYRSHPAVAALKEQVEAGEIGTILTATVTSGQHFPTYRPAYRQIYYSRRATGGGAIQDALTHMVNLVQHLVGRYDWVFADYAHQALDGVEVEDSVTLVGRLNAGAVLASLTLNQFMAPNETTLDLHGTKGSLRFEVHRQRWGILRHGDGDWSFSPPLALERDDVFIRQASRFLDALKQLDSGLCTLDDAEHTLRVCLAALHSGAIRRPVTPDEIDATFDPADLETTK